MSQRNNVRIACLIIVVCVGSYAVCYWRGACDPQHQQAEESLGTRFVESPSAPLVNKAGQEAALDIVFEREGFRREGSEREVAGTVSGLRTFVDSKGVIVREVRIDLEGHIVAETRHCGDDALTVERSYRPDGRLLVERMLRNGVLLRENVLH